MLCRLLCLGSGAQSSADGGVCLAECSTASDGAKIDHWFVWGRHGPPNRVLTQLWVITAELLGPERWTQPCCGCTKDIQASIDRYPT